jgi:hypothetical protein
MIDRGYTDRPIRQLSDAEVLEEALQAADSAGHYAMTDFACGPLHTEAINRRNVCFAELKRRLQLAAELVEAADEVGQHIEEDEAWNDHANDRPFVALRLASAALRKVTDA